MKGARIKVEILTEVYATRDYRLYRKYRTVEWRRMKANLCQRRRIHERERFQGWRTERKQVIHGSEHRIDLGIGIKPPAGQKYKRGY